METRQIVLTDRPTPTPIDPRACPDCRKVTRRMMSAGFGKVAREKCEVCGHDFGEREL